MEDNKFGEYQKIRMDIFALFNLEELAEFRNMIVEDINEELESKDRRSLI